MIADTDHEIKLLEIFFASNLKKMVHRGGTKLRRCGSYPLALSTTRNQALVAENGVLKKENSYLKGLMMQTTNDRMTLNDIGKCNSLLNYGITNICCLCYILLVLVIKMSYVPSDQQQDSRHWDQEVREAQQEIVAFEQEVREQQLDDREAHQDQREAQQDTREQQQDKRYKKIERYIT